MVSVSAKGRTGSVNSLHSSGRKRKGPLSRLLRRILPALVILSLWTPAGFAADIVVMTAEDRLDASFATFGISVTDFTTFCGAVVDLAAFPADPSLREALIYANHMPGPDTITFAPDLSGQTIMISFDGSDEGEQADPLPSLCGGDLTLNGDVNGDGMSDITLDGSNLSPDLGWGLFAESDNNTINGFTFQNFPYIGIIAGAGTRTAAVTGNRITNNTIDGGQFGISVFAGFFLKGTVQDTTVSGNTVSGTTFFGINYGTYYTGSSLDGTQITHNVVSNNAGGGIWSQSSDASGGGRCLGHEHHQHHNSAQYSLRKSLGGHSCPALWNQ